MKARPSTRSAPLMLILAGLVVAGEEPQWEAKLNEEAKESREHTQSGSEKILAAGEHLMDAAVDSLLGSGRQKASYTVKRVPRIKRLHSDDDAVRMAAAMRGEKVSHSAHHRHPHSRTHVPAGHTHVPAALKASRCISQCCINLKESGGSAVIGASCSRLHDHDPVNTCARFQALANTDDDDDTKTSGGVAEQTLTTMALYITFSGNQPMRSAMKLCECITSCMNKPEKRDFFPTLAPFAAPTPITSTPTASPTQLPTLKQGHTCLKNACLDMTQNGHPLKVPCVDLYEILVMNIHYTKYRADPCRYYVRAQLEKDSESGTGYDTLMGVFSKSLAPAKKLCSLYSECVGDWGELATLASQDGVKLPTVAPTSAPSASMKKAKSAYQLLLALEDSSKNLNKKFIATHPPTPTSSKITVLTPHRLTPAELATVEKQLHPNGTSAPSASPSTSPTKSPAPTLAPTLAPSLPTWRPTKYPTPAPTQPTSAPTTPTQQPSPAPTLRPTTTPTATPTKANVWIPPTVAPPTASPTFAPSLAPTLPTSTPTPAPTDLPTLSRAPTRAPTPIATADPMITGAILVHRHAVCQKPNKFGIAGQPMHGNLLSSSASLLECARLCRDAKWCGMFYFSGEYVGKRGKCKRIDSHLFQKHGDGKTECKFTIPSDKFSVYRTVSYPNVIRQNVVCVQKGKPAPVMPLSSKPLSMLDCFQSCLHKPKCHYFYYLKTDWAPPSFFKVVAWPGVESLRDGKVAGTCSMITTEMMRSSNCSVPKRGNFIFKVEHGAISLVQ